MKRMKGEVEARGEEEDVVSVLFCLSSLSDVLTTVCVCLKVVCVCVCPPKALLQ